MIFTSGLNGRLFLHRLCSCVFSPQEHIACSILASSLLMCIFATVAYRRCFVSSLPLCSSDIRNGKRGSSIEHQWPQCPFVFASSLCMRVYATGTHRLLLLPLRYCAAATSATARTAAPMAVRYCIVFGHFYATGASPLFLRSFSACAVATFAMARVAAASDI